MHIVAVRERRGGLSLSVLKPSFLLILLLAFPTSLYAQEAGIDAIVNAAVQPLTDFVSNFIFFEVTIGATSLPLIVVWLIAAATFFTLYFGFINFRGLAHSIRIIRGDYASPNHTGEVNHF
jgi:AGCS family alanine or glycine:cation symporter|tara:strand:+ start:651 stop:1013 length:363 start_codon:yes stop_codon:yes gene_type:complete